jgi:ribosomal protein L37AE/L43A
VTTLRTRLARLEQHHAPAPHMTVVVTRIGDPDPDTERVHTCRRCGRQTTARGAETVVYCAPCPKRSTATTPPAGEA